MFEEEAEEYAEGTKTEKELEVLNTVHDWGEESLSPDERRLLEGVQDRKRAREQGFKDGAEFGYNKANEWHYVKDEDLPERGDADFIRILIVHHNHITIANYDGDWKSTAGHKISIPYAWKELPKPPREESELSEKNTK